MKYHIF